MIPWAVVVLNYTLAFIIVYMYCEMHFFGSDKFESALITRQLPSEVVFDPHSGVVIRYDRSAKDGESADSAFAEI